MSLAGFFAIKYSAIPPFVIIFEDAGCLEVKR